MTLNHSAMIADEPHRCSSRAVALYHRAAEVAERALVIDPAAGFALTDVAPPETVLAELRNPSLGIAVVAGSLTAAVCALSRWTEPSGDGAAWALSRVPLPPAPGVTDRHMVLALALLTSSVRLGLTEHERGDLVTVMTSWGDDFEAFIDRSSLALCILAAAAALLAAGAGTGAGAGAGATERQ